MEPRVEPHLIFTPCREVDFALLGDTLTIGELSFSPQPVLGLALPTASPPALGIMASKTPPAAAQLLPHQFSRGCLHALSWPTGISPKASTPVVGDHREGWRLEQLPCGSPAMGAGVQQGKFV